MANTQQSLHQQLLFVYWYFNVYLPQTCMNALASPWIANQMASPTLSTLLCLYATSLILAATDVGIAVCSSFLFDFLSWSFLPLIFCPFQPVTIPTSDFFATLSLFLNLIFWSLSASDHSYIWFLSFLASECCCVTLTLQYF